MKNRYLYKVKGSSAFTLLELILAIAILGILAAIALPAYSEYINRARSAVALADIRAISQIMIFYFMDNERYPDDLAQIGMANARDPWGNPYQYLSVASAKGKGTLRKDRAFNPVNSDYDLYSKGADGKSATPFTAASSQDDIVRANNGAYFGLVKDY